MSLVDEIKKYKGELSRWYAEKWDFGVKTVLAKEFNPVFVKRIEEESKKNMRKAATTMKNLGIYVEKISGLKHYLIRLYIRGELKQVLEYD